jgi:predicted DNA-binding transcriptional regulator AlpA
MFDLTQDSILSPQAVRQCLGVSRPTLWRLTKAGGFPPPIRLSPNRIGWSRRAIEAWLTSNVIERTPEAA